MSAPERRLSADEFDRRISRLMAVTAVARDPLYINGAVARVLRLMCDILQMDVAFVSEFTGDRRVFRHVESGGQKVLPVGASDPLEQSFCQRVVDGRLSELVHDVAKLPNVADLPPTPFPIGAHLSTAIVLDDGRIYGTLCCFSFSPNDALTQRDLKRLQMAAQMMARLINQDNARARGA